MANTDHIAKLNEGHLAWNQWRVENPSIRPDLSEVDLGSENAGPLIKSVMQPVLRPVVSPIASGGGTASFDLQNYDLSDVDLRGADLRNANLNGADLTNADLSPFGGEGAVGTVPMGGAIATGATRQLKVTDLRGASLNKTQLRGTILRGVDLRGAIGLSCVQLKRATDWRMAVRDETLACGEAIPTRAAVGTLVMLQAENITLGAPKHGKPPLQTNNEGTAEGGSGKDGSASTNRVREPFETPSLVSNVPLSERDGILAAASGVRMSAAALLDHLDQLRPNATEAQETIEAVRAGVSDLLTNIDSFRSSLEAARTEDEANRAGQILGEKLLRTLEAWSEVPAGDRAVKTAMGIIILGAAALFNPAVSGELSFSVMGTAIYGKEAVTAVWDRIVTSLNKKK